MSEFKPVAWLLMDGTIISEYSYNLRKLKEDGDIPLFTQRTWVGLTELEKAEITNLKWWDWEDTFDIDGFIKAIEAKLKEKNNG